MVLVQIHFLNYLIPLKIGSKFHNLGQPIKDLKRACFDQKRQKFNVINLEFNNFIGYSLPEKIYDTSGKLIVEMPKEYSKF